MKYWKTKNEIILLQILSGRSNVFLILKNGKSILVDTSTVFMWNTLRKRLKKLNIDKIDYLLLTHTHFDHVANAAKIKELYKAKVIVHKDEANNLENGKNILPGGTNFFTRLLTRLLAMKVASMVDYSPCDSDILIDSYFDLNEFGFDAIILHTPGHSHGSVSLIINNEIALVGDTMFGVFKGSAFPPFAENVSQMIDSWGKLLETGCSLFIPSHGTANSRLLVLKDFERRKTDLNSIK